MNDLRAALESDIDVMRDVYMTRSQREAFDRLLARLTGEGSGGYYLATFKHGRCQGHVLWWGPNNCGYTPDLATAGVYANPQPGYHDSAETVPVPVALVDRFRVRRMIDPSDTLNAPLWTAESLRAWIAEQSASTPPAPSGEVK